MRDQTYKSYEEVFRDQDEKPTTENQVDLIPEIGHACHVHFFFGKQPYT